MTHLDDGTLVAFVDGELDAAAMRRVAEAIEHDPDAAEKVRLLRLSATLVRAAFREPRHLQVSSELAQAIEERPQMTPVPVRRIGRRFIIASVASIAATVAKYSAGLVDSNSRRRATPGDGGAWRCG